MVVGRSIGMAAGTAPGGRGGSRSLPTASRPSVRVRVRPSNGSRSIRDETHTFFPRFSEWTRGQRLRTRAAGAGRRKGEGTCRPPEGKHLSVDEGDGHGLGPPPRSRPREAKTGRCGRTQRERGRVAVAERHVITDYSGAAGAIAMPAERRGCSGGLTSIRQTGRTRRTGRKEGGLAWHRKSAVIRGENIPGNSLENFLGIR